MNKLNTENVSKAPCFPLAAEVFARSQLCSDRNHIIYIYIFIYKTQLLIPLTVGSGAINACSRCVFSPCIQSETTPLTDEKQVLLYLGRIFFLPIWGSVENVLQGSISL